MCILFDEYILVCILFDEYILVCILFDVMTPGHMIITM